MSRRIFFFHYKSGLHLVLSTHTITEPTVLCRERSSLLGSIPILVCLPWRQASKIRYRISQPGNWSQVFHTAVKHACHYTTISTSRTIVSNEICPFVYSLKRFRVSVAQGIRYNRANTMRLTLSADEARSDWWWYATRAPVDSELHFAFRAA